jgi:hypothetical protein
MVLGAVIGFVGAVMRPRSADRADPRRRVGAQPQPPVTPQVRQVESPGAGADLPTRPIPLPIPSALSGTGGAR